MDFDFVGDLIWLTLDSLPPLSLWVPDALDEFVDEQRKVVRIEEANEARIQKLTSIGSGEVFPAGFVILQQPGSSHRIKKDVIVAVTKDDLVVLNADVRRDPDGEIGRIHKADVPAFGCSTRPATRSR